MEDYEELYGAGNEMNQAAGPFISRPNLQLLLQTNSRVSPVPPVKALQGIALTIIHRKFGMLSAFFSPTCLNCSMD
jgi:hypothetical protein